MLDYYFRSGYVIMSNGWHRRVRVSQKSKVFEKKTTPHTTILILSLN